MQDMMDEETENVINLMFPNGLPNQLQDSPEFYSYLSKLGTFRVEQLVKEPERLAEEKSAVLEQTQELAFSNYKTFIQTAECSRAIFQQFKETEERLDSLLDRLPRLSQECQEFGRTSVGLEQRRRMCSLTLARSTQLLELLELPQLMNLCVSGHHYEEALQLSTFARRLERRHGDIPAIQSIVADTQAGWRTMLQQLLAQLRSDLPLPRCLLLVGLLRRMAVFSEAELRLKFLQARDTWLRSLLEAIPAGPEHLLRTIELSRQHLFAIATQYRAAFSDDPSSGSGGAEVAIFHGWLTEKITQFVLTLEADLDQLNENEPLDSILNQCMYFGLSLARVGADFRALLAPVFIKVIKKNFECSIKKACKDFENHMEKFNFDKISNVGPTQSTSATQFQPSNSLLQFPPLALFLNALLTSVNTLRLCAPLAVATFVTHQLKLALTLAARIILARCRQEQQAFTSAERQGVQRLCACFSDDLVPHVQRCLLALYPPATLAMHLALSQQQVQKEGIGVIDKAEVIDVISHLLPVQLEPITLLPPVVPEAEQEEPVVLAHSSPNVEMEESSSATEHTENETPVLELEINTDTEPSAEPETTGTPSIESQVGNLNLSESDKN